MTTENTETPNIYEINVANLERLEAELADLNKKADRCGCPRAVLTFHGEKTKTRKNDLGVEYTVTFKLVSISGATPKFAGWTLVAVIEQQTSGENLVSCVPGQTVPTEYRETNNRCDYCGHERKRKEVFIIRHESGEHRQVGRQCLGDFLGTQTPESILAWAAYCFDLVKTVEEARDESWGCGRGESTFNLDEFLKTTAVCIRKLGWISRSVAMQLEDGPRSTANVVAWLLSPAYTAQDKADKRDFINKFEIVAEDRDMELATAALEWGKALPTDQGDYLYNLGVAVRIGYVRPKTEGIVASLIAAYQRHLDREEEPNMRKAAAKNRVHVGEVGARQGFAGVTVKALRSFDSDYGVKTLVRFEDADGNVLIWWASGDPDWLKEGDVLDITATVKEHGEYKETKQTVIQRVAKGIKQKKGKKNAA